MPLSLHLLPCCGTARWFCTYHCSHAGSQQHAAAVFHATLLHTPKEGLSLPEEADLSAATQGAAASHAAEVSNVQQQQSTLSGEGVGSIPKVPPQLPSHGSGSTAAQTTSPAVDLSVSAHTNAGTQINPTTALTPLLLLPHATQQQRLVESRHAVQAAQTPPAVSALSAVAITPATRQSHASLEQSLSPQPAMDTTLSEQQQQQTSRGNRNRVSAIDDLSELELDVESATGVPAMVNSVPAAQPPAHAASHSVSQKRPTRQAPPDLTSPTIPSAKKHKLDDGSANACTAGRSSAQPVGSASKAQQLKMPHPSTSQTASPQWHANQVPTSLSSQPPAMALSMTSSPLCKDSQKTVTLPVKLPRITEAAATRTTLPQHPHAAAGKLNSNMVQASQQIVLSLPAIPTGPSARAAFVTVSCQMPAAQCSAAAPHPPSTAATASACTAVQTEGAHASFAQLSHSLVTFYSNSGNTRSSPILPSITSSLPRQASSSYQPVIEELPSDFAAAAPKDIRAVANNVPPSKPMVIDIDSDDDDHTVAANSQPAASLQGRQGQGSEPGQPQDSMARLSSDAATQSNPASAVTRCVQGQACLSAHPPPATEVTPCATTEPAAAIKMGFGQLPAPMGMGDIFSSFAALEDLSDAEEEEEAGADSAAATSAAAGQLNNTDSAGGHCIGQTLTSHSFLHSTFIQGHIRV